MVQLHERLRIRTLVRRTNGSRLKAGMTGGEEAVKVCV
jgi:hypothetical protein